MAATLSVWLVARAIRTTLGTTYGDANAFLDFITRPADVLIHICVWLLSTKIEMS